MKRRIKKSKTENVSAMWTLSKPVLHGKLSTESAHDANHGLSTIKLFCLINSFSQAWRGVFIKPSIGALAILLWSYSLTGVAQNKENYRTAILDGESQINCYFTYPGESSAVRYPQGKSVYIKGSDMNELELSALDNFIRGALADSMVYIRRIRMIGYCSIEGDYFQNERLARRRAEGMRDVLRSSYPELETFPISVSWVPEDWETLYNLVSESDLSERKEVMAIIGKSDMRSSGKELLRKFNGGKPYKQITEQFFPLLRRVEICVEYDVPRILEHKYNRQLTQTQFEQALSQERERLLADKEVAVDDAQEKIFEHLGSWARTLNELQVDSMPQAETLAEMEIRLKNLRELRRKLCPLCEDVLPTFAIKTNVLYDLTATINLGVEFKVSRKLTIDIPVSHNPFTFSGKRKWKHTLVQPELRYWTRAAFAGHFVGAHLHLASFNVSNVPGISKTKDHRYEGWFTGAGVSYGYHKALSDHWAIEGTIGAGYAYSEYDKFECKDCGEKMGRRKKHYFGPTKAGISLIYTFRK